MWPTNQRKHGTMRKTVIASALALSLSAGLAHAQSDEKGFYAGIDIGRSSLNVSGLNENHDTALGINAGYRFNRNFALEGGYAHLGNFSPSYQAHALSLSAIGILPLQHGFSVYGKVGYARTHSDAVGASDHADSALVGLGAMYDFNRTWFAKAGVDHYAKVGGPKVAKAQRMCMGSASATASERARASLNRNKPARG